MAKYVAGPKFTTPRAAAIWPNLNTPDTKHNADGVYDCKQELPLNNEIVRFHVSRTTPWPCSGHGVLLRSDDVDAGRGGTRRASEAALNGQMRMSPTSATHEQPHHRNHQDDEDQQFQYADVEYEQTLGEPASQPKRVDARTHLGMGVCTGRGRSGRA